MPELLTYLTSSVERAERLDVSTGAGRSLARLLCLVRAELRDRDGLIREPVVASRLWRGVLTGLLLAADDQYRAAAPSRPRHIKRAIDVMEADPSRPLTVAELARVAGVSVRALQDGFHRHVGVPPMTYLRRLRLARAHADLCRAAPGEETVAAVAHRWGFAHLGRFAAEYRREYGVSPVTTLGG